jgi:hypothetical protein
MTGTATAADHLVVAYFTATTTPRGDHIQMLQRAGASRLASNTLLQELWLDLNGDHDFDYETVADVDAVIVANANLDPDFVIAQLDCEPAGVAAAAAGNAGLGAERVAELWDSTRYAWLLSNPHMRTETVTRHAETHPLAVANNPNATRTALRRAYATPAGRRTVLCHPRCPTDLIADELERDTLVMNWFLDQPQVTDAQLEALERRTLLGATPGNSHVTSAGRRTRRAQLITAELERRQRLRSGPIVADLRHGDAPDDVAAVLRAGGDHADALIALIRHGFDGTVTELIGVASGLVAA